MAVKPPVGAPYAPPDYTIKDVGAIQALQRGDAPAHQQQRALKFIIETLCGAYDLSYRPGSDRDTTFAEGRRFVGLQIVKLLHLNLQALEKTSGRTDRDPERPA